MPLTAEQLEQVRQVAREEVTSVVETLRQELGTLLEVSESDWAAAVDRYWPSLRTPVSDESTPPAGPPEDPRSLFPGPTPEP